jgi:hypothetical protein
MVISSLNTKLIEDRLGLVNSALKHNLTDIEFFVTAIRDFLVEYKDRVGLAE